MSSNRSTGLQVFLPQSAIGAFVVVAAMGCAGAGVVDRTPPAESSSNTSTATPQQPQPKSEGDVVKVLPGSQLNEAQLQETKAIVDTWLAEQARSEDGKPSGELTIAPEAKADLVKKLNAKLADFAVKPIRGETRTLEVSYMSGFAGLSAIGVSIQDRDQKYCFPCRMAHNDFEWGVVETKKGSAKKKKSNKG